ARLVPWFHAAANSTSSAPITCLRERIRQTSENRSSSRDCWTPAARLPALQRSQHFLNSRISKIPQRANLLPMLRSRKLSPEKWTYREQFLNWAARRLTDDQRMALLLPAAVGLPRKAWPSQRAAARQDSHVQQLAWSISRPRSITKRVVTP